MKHDLLLL